MLLIEEAGCEYIEAARNEVGHLADALRIGGGQVDKVLQKLDDDAVDRAYRERTDEHGDLGEIELQELGHQRQCELEIHEYNSHSRQHA